MAPWMDTYSQDVKAEKEEGSEVGAGVAETPTHDDPRVSGTFFFLEALSQGMLLASPGTGDSAEKHIVYPCFRAPFRMSLIGTDRQGVVG